MGLLNLGRRKRRRRSRRGFSLLRFLGPGATVGSLLALGGAVMMGKVDLSMFDMSGEGEMVAEDDAQVPRDGRAGSGGDARLVTRSGRRPSLPPPDAPGAFSPHDTIRIASFNIQIFGPKKTANSVVMDQIAQVVSRFDVIAIQEIHGKDAEPIRELVARLRRGGAPYAASVSQPIGSAKHKESYAFLWNETTMQMIESSDYVVNDPADRMFREPMVASFRCRLNPLQNETPFTFTLINVHTSPSRVASSALDNEMNVLDDVFLSVADFGYQRMLEDDCILLGDLNVNERNLRELGQIPNLRSVIGDRPTNAKQTKTYDHIMVDSKWTDEFTGNAGVFDLQTELKLDAEAAEAISDHYPVWAEFRRTESVPPSAISSRTRIIR